MRIGIDLDGVTYDFVGNLREWAISHGAHGKPELPAERWDFFLDWGWTSEEFLRYFGDAVRSTELFWTGRPVPGAVEALGRLKAAGHEIVIVTHRGHPDPVVSRIMREATVHWLDLYSIPHDSLIFDGTKTRLGIDVLLDDAPHQIEAAREAGERAVFFTQPWNADEEGERVGSWVEFERLVAASRIEVVGVSGKAQHGKDTIGARLVSRYAFERASFADALRSILAAVDPVVLTIEGNLDGHGHLPPRSGYRYVTGLRDYVEANGWEEAKRRTEARELQIRLGMAMRAIDPDFWVKTALSTLRPGGRYVFTDVRFPNEAKAIVDAGGTLVRVERPGVESSDHESETALDTYPFDLTIVNDKAVWDLVAVVDAIADEYGWSPF